MLATTWSAEGRDEEGTPVRDVGSVSCSAAIEIAAQKDTDPTPSEFAALVVAKQRFFSAHSATAPVLNSHSSPPR